MENLLREYMERTFNHPGQPPGAPCGTGAVITLSREFGCPSKLIAQMLTQTLNRRPGKFPRWKTINKEIVEESAHRLNISEVDMHYLINSGNKGLVEDILTSFSLTYVSSVRLRTTLTSAIRMFAGQGNVVLVGRGGAGILHGCPNTLHVRLMAPLDWRASDLAKRRQITLAEATRLATGMDQKRTSLLEFLAGCKVTPSLFDVICNCSTLTPEEIVAMIVNLLEIKKMV